MYYGKDHCRGMYTCLIIVLCDHPYLVSVRAAPQSESCQSAGGRKHVIAERSEATNLDDGSPILS